MMARTYVAAALALVAGCNAGSQSAPVPGVPPRVASIVEGRNHRAGSLDHTFGKDGKVLLTSAMAPVMAVAQPGGAIVIAGNGPGESQNTIVRLLANGQLDPSFGHGGYVSLNLYAAYTIALAPDGKLLVGGIASANNDQDAALVRLNADGTLDSGFGSGGVVAFQYVTGTSNSTFAILVQPNGDVVAGGSSLSKTKDADLTALARFDSGGNFDPTFGTNGVVAVAAVGAVTAMGLQSNGDILVCGGPFDPSASLMVRFSANGKLDRTDRGGKLVSLAHTGSLTFEGSNEFQRDGKLLQWTVVNAGSDQEAEVIRLLRNQSPDPHFTVTPFAFDEPGSINAPRDVEEAADGTLLVAGAGTNAGNASVFGVARLLASGQLDPSFGHDGRVVTFAADSQATALTIQSDGKIVAAGTIVPSGSSPEVGVARYLAK